MIQTPRVSIHHVINVTVSVKTILIGTFSSYYEKNRFEVAIQAAVVLLCWTLAMPNLQYN